MLGPSKKIITALVLIFILRLRFPKGKSVAAINKIDIHIKI